MQTESFYNQFDAILLKPKRFTLACHVNPDGDAIGSMLAMAEFLRLKGHEVKMVCANAFPDFLAWMPGADEILIYEMLPWPKLNASSCWISTLCRGPGFCITKLARPAVHV